MRNIKYKIRKVYIGMKDDESAAAAAGGTADGMRYYSVLNDSDKMINTCSVRLTAYRTACSVGRTVATAMYHAYYSRHHVS